MSVFEVLASTDAEEQERVAGTRAVIATQERVKEQFEKFVGKARNDEDRETRLAMIDDQVRKVASDVAAMYAYEDAERLYLAGTAVLGGGHKDGCECGFCKNKGKLPGSKSEKSEDEVEDEGDDNKKESSTNCDCACDNCKTGAHCSGDTCVESKHSGHPGNGEVSKEAGFNSIWHTAADTETGDTFVTERVKLPVSDGKSALGDTGAVPTDTSRVPDKGLKPIDVPSKMHPVEQQAMHATPDYSKELPGPSATGERQDAPSKTGPDGGDRTKTWSGTEGLADPVTSRVAKWSVTE